MQADTDQRSDQTSQARSLVSVLYTQNPFYLISCGFVLYGLLVSSQSIGNLMSRANFLATSLGSYTALMALTAILVIRLGKVWQDARTILLVVIIGQIAYSISVDEVCLADSSAAMMYLSAGFVGAFVITELVLQLSGIRFPFWYRVPYYGIVAVFFSFPILAGHFRTSGSEFANWSPLFFSMAVGAAMLLLIPAVRRGKSMCVDNGTPWTWPLFPLSAFVILLVLAGFRAHAIWMSFGSLIGTVGFEPLLLLPLAMAVFVLVIEGSLAAEKKEIAVGALWLSPVMLACGLGSFARTPQAFDVGLSLYGGSSMTVVLVMLALFYLYARSRGILGTEHAVVALMLSLAFFGRTPTALEGAGWQPWMIGAIASTLYFLFCQMRPGRESLWLGFTASCAATMVMAGIEYDQLRVAIALAASWCVLMFMYIGYVFDTLLATLLRRTAAVTLISGAIVLAGWNIVERPVEGAILILLATVVTSAVYLLLVRRWAWSYVALVQAACFLAVAGKQGAIQSFQWALQLGIVFFMIAVGITIWKTGCIQTRYRRHTHNRPRLAYRPGF